ncbi:MAG: MFS transporter [Flectobacillus sp.]|uniref:MFS transporter n=1 Tax=Flectobacillus sp. TaxID=50419 RepID=UPI003B995581
MKHLLQHWWIQRYYPFLICFSGLVILVVVNGLTSTTISVFDRVLLNEFQWSRSELKLRDSIPNATAFALIFLSGTLIDKFRVRRLLLTGSLILSIALYSYSLIHSKSQAYFIHFLFGIAYSLSGSVSAIILVSGWFQKHKGLALGITLAGTSLGSFLFPNLIQHWLDLWGWRSTFRHLAIFPMVLFAFIFLFVKSTPSELGLKAFGSESEPQKSDIPLQEPLNEGISFEKALQTPTFWLISICGFLTFYGLLGVVANLFLHITDLGFSAKDATFALTLYFGVAFGGKLLITSLSDFFNTQRVFTLCCLLMTVSVLGFTTLNKDFIFWATAGMALSWGGIYSMYNVLTIKTFGLKSAGKINGTINMFESAGAFCGPIFTGFIYDKTHSYQIAFLIITCIMGFATLLSFLFSPPKNTLPST